LALLDIPQWTRRRQTGAGGRKYSKDQERQEGERGRIEAVAMVKGRRFGSEMADGGGESYRRRAFSS
jgi:hypothetical protein